jgi:hypothetical protein
MLPITEKAKIVSVIERRGYAFVSTNNNALMKGIDYLKQENRIQSLKDLGYDFKNSDEIFTFTGNPFQLRLMHDKSGYIDLIPDYDKIQPIYPLDTRNKSVEWILIENTSDKLICVCDNPKYGFNCTCEWEKNHPGDIFWSCEFCGLYQASKPKCNRCER